MGSKEFKHPLFRRAPVDYAVIRGHVMDYLTERGPLKYIDIEDELLDAYGHSRPATRQAIRYLKDDGYLSQEKPGAPWKIVMRKTE